MAICQLTVFVENKQGSLIEITEALAANNIDIRALSIADTKDFGILRMIVNEPEKAKEILDKTGCIVKITDVVGVKIGDQPGKLSQALKVLSGAGVNIEYLYAFFSRTPRHAYVVLRVADNDAADSALEKAGFHTISSADIIKL